MVRGESGEQLAGSTRGAKCELPAGVVGSLIGAPVTVADVSVVPQWYGADHSLVLYTWPEVQRPPLSEPSGSMAAFMRPVRSIVGLYPMPYDVDGGQGARPPGPSAGGAMSAAPRPARCLYALCRMSSLEVVPGRSHLVVGGTEMGSLQVWDLRGKPHAPSRMAPVNSAEGDGLDSEEAHFEGAIWMAPVFSTDQLAFKDELGGDFHADMAGGVHFVEICCVRCSDVVGGDSLIFALDLMGTVSFWRVLEPASGTSVPVKLALTGKLSLTDGSNVLGDFLSSPFLSIHPQQQARFIVASTAGLLQCFRKRAASISEGPAKLDLNRHTEEDWVKNDELLGTASITDFLGSGFDGDLPLTQSSNEQNGAVLKVKVQLDRKGLK
ncbi:unnamed protein product, partial [Prorocentrum cordatum]